MGNVRRDMSLGKVAEDKVADILKNADLPVEKVDKINRLFWDLSFTLSENIYTIEVKNDIYALKSGNIAIELYNTKSGKESGLTSTKANLWAVVVGDEVWIANTNVLRGFINSNKPDREISNAGDGNAYIYLYKKDLLFSHVFSRIDNWQDKKTLVEFLEDLV